MVVRSMLPFLELFHDKRLVGSGKEGYEQASLKQALRGHIVLKSEALWQSILAEAKTAEDPNTQLERVFKDILYFNVSHETVEKLFQEFVTQPSDQLASAVQAYCQR